MKFMKTQLLSSSGYVCTHTILAVQLSGGGAAQELLVEVLPKAFAHQVQSKWIHTGVGEGQDACKHTGDEVTQRRVHLIVVVRAVQVDHVTGEPADSKQANKHQDSFRQTFPGLDLTGEDRRNQFPQTNNAVQSTEGNGICVNVLINIFVLLGWWCLSVSYLSFTSLV